MSNEQNLRLQTPSGKAMTWAKMEKWVAIVGTWSWLPNILYAILGIMATIASIGNINAEGSFSGFIADQPQRIVYFMFIALCFLIIIFYVIRVFSRKCKSKDWKFLVTDVFKVGHYRVPKMIFYSGILTVFAYGFVGLFVLIPALLIIMYGPVEFKWKL